MVYVQDIQQSYVKTYGKTRTSNKIKTIIKVGKQNENVGHK